MNSFTKPEDCQKCGQTIQNCECHIPDKEKHRSLYNFIKLLFDKSD